ncbi:MAG: thermonuclease family protein [Nitrospiria bacterium]
MPKTVALILLALFYLASGLSAAEPFFSYSFNGTVMDVLEGDVLSVLHKGKLIKVRLADVDCPEEGQAFSNEARKFSALLVYAGPVKVKVKELDRRGQAVAEVILLDKGLSLNRELIKAGLAWWSWKNSDDMSYGDLEEAAREMKVGLWKAKEPTPPWEYHLKKDGH